MHNPKTRMMSKNGEDKIYSSRTRLAHAGRDSLGHAGAVNLPVYRASTILHESVEALQRTKPRFTYGRRGTPLSAGFEAAITELHGGAASVLTPSGLSACAVAMMAATEAGSEILMTDAAYEPTRVFTTKTLKRFGVTTRLYDPLIGGAIAGMITDKTRAVLVESPGSQTFEVQDVPAIAAAAQARGVCVIADNTWASPLLCQPLGLGADIVIESGTKYIVGHADANIGIVTANAAWAERLRETHYHLGQCAGGDDIYLALRGLRTLGVRIAEAERTARALIAYFKNHSMVDRVLYPGEPDDPGHEIWRRDFKGASGLFGVALKPMPQKALGAMLDGLKLFGMGYSYGGYESLVIPVEPHRSVRKVLGGPMIRISAGLEDPADLIADLETGFARAKSAS
jgi:cysteine-S-conjugate beta-lyase